MLIQAQRITLRSLFRKRYCIVLCSGNQVFIVDHASHLLRRLIAHGATQRKENSSHIEGAQRSFSRRHVRFSRVLCKSDHGTGTPFQRQALIKLFSTDPTQPSPNETPSVCREPNSHATQARAPTHYFEESDHHDDGRACGPAIVLESSGDSGRDTDAAASSGNKNPHG